MSNYIDDLTCPECKVGELIPQIENCSCHINPPCSACTNADLKCNECGFYLEYDDAY